MYLAVILSRNSPLQAFDSAYPILAALTFFAIGSCVQRALVRPVAAMVYRQERLEGDFRWVRGAGQYDPRQSAAHS